MLLKYTGFLFVLLAFTASSQNYKKRYKALAAAKDTASLRVLLHEWWENDPNDADLFAGYFNYYLLVGKSTKAGKSTYTPESLKKAVWYIDRGIQAFPDRLDLRFGKIYLLGETGRYDAYAEEIIKTLNHSVKNHNAWRWTNNVPQAAPNDFMLTCIHEYVMMLVRSGETVQMEKAGVISEAVLKHYPNFAPCITTLAVYYRSKSQAAQAEKLLYRSVAINPGDSYTLLQLADLLKAEGQPEKAITFYEKVLQIGEPDEKEIAQKELRQLQAPKK